jgi:hypothetical protein
MSNVIMLMPWIQRKEKIFDQIEVDDECFEDLVHRDAWM